MTGDQIQPHKVTKPIQLLAAWLVGLVVTVAIFLGAALQLEPSTWERGALIVAAIVFVPLFLVAMFVLQTKFRAELQEDYYYAEHLSRKTSQHVRIEKASVEARLDELELRITNVVHASETSRGGEGTSQWDAWPVALNTLHPRFEEIREALRTANIPVSEIFGREIPSKWVIAINHAIPAKLKADLLKTLMPFKFDGFLLWNPERLAGETEDVYIGSYGDQRSYGPMTSELAQLLEKPIDNVDLRHYVDQYGVPH